MAMNVADLRANGFSNGVEITKACFTAAKKWWDMARQDVEVPDKTPRGKVKELIATHEASCAAEAAKVLMHHGVTHGVIAKDAEGRSVTKPVPNDNGRDLCQWVADYYVYVSAPPVWIPYPPEPVCKKCGKPQTHHWNEKSNEWELIPCRNSHL